MLILKNIRFKNFLAFGNQFTEIDFLRNPTTMMIGKSGGGKSTMADALCFVLFGKPFRPVPKGKLVNTVNNKDCLVEIDLEIDSTPYKIRRGMKPDVFEIYKGDDLINQDAKVRDYQKWLEENVVKMNFKTCVQTVILGYANYTPFMELNAAERRAIVDQILGIDVFTKMNVVVSQRLKNIRIELTIIDKEIDILRSSVETSKQLVMKVKSQDEDAMQAMHDEIASLDLQVSQLMEQRGKFQSEAQDLSKAVEDLAAINLSITEMRQQLSRFRTLIEQNSQLQAFMENNDVCMTCHQHIDSNHKSHICSEAEAKNDELKTKAQPIHSGLTANLALVEEKARQHQQLNTIERSIARADEQINQILKQKQQIQLKLSSTEHNDESVLSMMATKVLEQIDKLKELDKKKQSMIDQRHYYEIHQAMLRDDGIKAQIVNQYIPELNKLINEYLDKMGFHMRFELNSEFEEKILSRFRDSLSYYSLSEGQKSRLSLAITLAWRKLAEIRNSSRCNVIILDEVLDANLAASDIESVWGIVEEITQESNVFIISHRPDALYDRVRSIINVELRGNFSEFVK